MISDLYWIPGPWRGRLAVAPRPRGYDWLDDDLASWRRTGIDLIVSLLEPAEAEDLGLADEARIASQTGIEFLSLPIPDRDVPVGSTAALQLVGNLVAELESGVNVAVHCRQGIGRSGLIAAAVLIAAGSGPEDAMRIVSDARGVLTPETAPQRDWLLSLPGRLATPA